MPSEIDVEPKIHEKFTKNYEISKKLRTISRLDDERKNQRKNGKTDCKSENYLSNLIENRSDR